MFSKWFIISIVILSIFFVGCSQKSYHNEMVEETKNMLGKGDYQGIKKSYTDGLVDEISKDKEFISILEDKSLSSILKEIEKLDGNLYFLKVVIF